MAKLQITAIEGEHQGEVLEAQFNPKEIEVDRTIPWQHLGAAPLQFLGADPAAMTFELLFDGVELSTSVQPRLDRLHRLSSVDETLHRPPRVNVAWGNAAGAIPAFDGVVETVSIRYLRFAENGVPLRARATVKIMEAPELSRTPKCG